jgi:hypothetical protein
VEGPHDKRSGQRTPVGLLLKLSYGHVDEFVEKFASNISRGGIPGPSAPWSRSSCASAAASPW